MNRLEENVFVNPEMVAEELPRFVLRVNEMVQENWRHANLTPHTYHIGGGRKYIRIVRYWGDKPNDRSVLCFVRASDGAVLKAASWKAPTLNFIRGSIFDEVLPVNEYGTRR